MGKEQISILEHPTILNMTPNEVKLQIQTKY